MKQQDNRNTLGEAGKYIKVLQIGEGRLLRTLIEPIIMQLIEKGWDGYVAVTNIRPNGTKVIKGLQEQGNKYNVILRDETSFCITEINFIIPLNLEENWKEILAISNSSTLEAIVCNSTEKGYVLDYSAFTPDKKQPINFIGTLTMILYMRFLANHQKQILILPTELIPRNGELLRDHILEQVKLWKLDSHFHTWMSLFVKFKNTIVDRISIQVKTDNEISFIEKMKGYIDSYVTLGEKFGRWYIEGNKSELMKLPLFKASEVILVDDIEPYQSMKLWILNGAHLFMACAGINKNLKTIYEVSKNQEIMTIVYSFWSDIGTYINLPQKIINDFIDTTLNRFQQQWIQHELSSIAINIPEKWKIRLGTFLEIYYKRENKYNLNVQKMTIEIIKFVSNSNSITLSNSFSLLTKDKFFIKSCFDLIDKQ